MFAVVSVLTHNALNVFSIHVEPAQGGNALRAKRVPFPLVANAMLHGSQVQCCGESDIRRCLHIRDPGKQKSSMDVVVNLIVNHMGVELYIELAEHLLDILSGDGRTPCVIKMGGERAEAQFQRAGNHEGTVDAATDPDHHVERFAPAHVFNRIHIALQDGLSGLSTGVFFVHLIVQVAILAHPRVVKVNARNLLVVETPAAPALLTLDQNALEPVVPPR